MLNAVIRLTVCIQSINDEFSSLSNEVDIRENELLLRYIDLVVANEIVNCIDFESMFIGVCSPYKMIIQTLLGEEQNLWFWREMSPY